MVLVAKEKLAEFLKRLQAVVSDEDLKVRGIHQDVLRRQVTVGRRSMSRMQLLKSLCNAPREKLIREG